MSKSTPRSRDHGKGIVVTYVQRGLPQQVIVNVPESGEPHEQQREAAHFVQTLADNGQLDGPNATHEIVADASGARRLQRRRFARR